VTRAGLTARAALGTVALVASLTACSGSDAPAVVGSPTGMTGTWDLTFGDEFSGTGLDRALWQPNRFGSDDGDAPFNPDIEAAWFSPDAVAVADGALQITEEPGPRTLGGRTYPYRSGVVQALPVHELRAGSFVEARIDVPDCAGCWPAFWAAATEGWPPELDVMEYFDTGQDTRPSFNSIRSVDERSGPTAYGDPAVDHRSGYHVYGMWWDGSQVVPYLDGVAYPDLTATDVRDVAMTIVLNLSVRADGAPPAGSQLLVDWVRVWQPAG
jgi:beta-glucanase (GH16 family)